LGFSTPNLAFLDENFQTRKTLHDNFLTSKNVLKGQFPLTIPMAEMPLPLEDGGSRKTSSRCHIELAKSLPVLHHGLRLNSQHRVYLPERHLS